MSDLEIVYIILVVQAIGMLIITAWYYSRRLKIEESKAESGKKQYDAMTQYHAERLDLEQKKLEVSQQVNGKKGEISEEFMTAIGRDHHHLEAPNRE